MDKQLHVVFPKDYMEMIVEALAAEGFTIPNKDYELETFYHWATAEGEYCPTALIIDTLDDDIPIEAKAEEYIRYLTDIRLNKPNMRLIINLPSQFKIMKQMQRSFVSLGIYDFYFEDHFSVQSILQWIENKRNLADVKNLITTDSYEEKMEETSHSTGEDSTELTEIHRGKTEEIFIEDDDQELGFSSILHDKFGDKVKGLKRLTDSFSINVNLPKFAGNSRSKVVEKYVTMIQQSIAFISLSKGAGSTFHSLNFASYLSEKGLDIGLYEQPVHFDGRSYIADVFDLFKTPNRQEASIPHMILERKPIWLEQVPEYCEVKVYATDYGQGFINNFKSEQFIRYLNTGKHTVKIMDFGYIPSHWLNESTFLDVLNTFQHIVVVVELLPTSFIPNFERFEFFKNFQDEYNNQSELWFLLNRYDSYIPKKELKKLELDLSHRCLALETNQVYKSMFDKKTPYDGSRDIQEELNIVYDDLFEDMGLNGEIKYKRKKALRGMFHRV